MLSRRQFASALAAMAAAVGLPLPVRGERKEVASNPNVVPMDGQVVVSGLDVGFLADPCAWVVCKVSSHPTEFTITRMHEWPVGTNQNTVIEDIGKMVANDNIEGHRMAVDIGGPGRQFADSLQARIPVDVQTVFVCRGEGWFSHGDTHHVSKGDLDLVFKHTVRKGRLHIEVPYVLAIQEDLIKAIMRSKKMTQDCMDALKFAVWIGDHG